MGFHVGNIIILRNKREIVRQGVSALFLLRSPQRFKVLRGPAEES